MSESFLLDLDVFNVSEVRGEEAFEGRRPVPEEAAREALDLQRARADGGRGALRQLDREAGRDDGRGGVGGGGGRGHGVAVVVVFQRFGRCQHNVVNMPE